MQLFSVFSFRSPLVVVALFVFTLTLTIQAQIKPLTLESFSKPLILKTSSENQTVEKKKDNRPTIVAVVVTGNHAILEKKIRTIITLKKGDKLNPYKINRNVKNIKSIGSFKSVSSDVEKKNGKATVTFIVEEFPIVSKIKFSGTSIVSQNSLLSTISSKSNKPYNLAQTRKDIKSIENYYHNRGYFQAKVYKVTNPNKKSKNLTFHVAEGIVDEIFITGNIKTQDYIIIREIDIKPGDVINEQQLKQNIRRIFNLNYFNQINPKFVPGSKPHTYRLEIEIVEKETNGSFTVGGGYSPNSGFSLFSDLYWDNIFGSGQLIMLKGNFAFGNSKLSNRNSTYQFKYHNPWMWDERKSFTFRTWLTDGNISSINPLGGNLTIQDETRRGFDVAIGIPHTYDFRTSHAAKYESVSLNDLGRFHSIYSYKFGTSYDTRDFRMNPREGMFHTASVEQTLKFRHNSLIFTQFELGLKRFIPTFKKQTIALRTDLGYLTSPQINDTELFNSEWYYIGGGSTVRGYDDLFPFAYGNKRIISSIEYRFLFTPTFQLVLFTDAGSSSLNTDVFHPSTWKIGKGVGIRLNVPPVGPIRLDLGIDEEGVSRVHFSMGHTF
ncbi:hypothetical protein DID80_05070 [Candidatus Marinamargulisbacteria bacterium SCGC AAA071-K20]|nr:hypothetical protein DID80_05070 [Candidatus Marinamargulisbacteria bacterium SCGC AAA071-K20]